MSAATVAGDLDARLQAGAEGDPVVSAVLLAFSVVKNVDLTGAPMGDDVFRTHDFDSIEKMRVLARIESLCDVSIGEDATDFERAQSLRGLIELVRERRTLALLASSDP